MKKRLSVPPEIESIAQTIEKAGFEAYLVGGCVRDLVLGREPKDWDLTTNANPEQIQGLFPETYCNNDYGTVGVVNPDPIAPSLKVVEVTPYRVESGYSDSRRPDSVEFSDTLEEDLKRRDFTINALAYSVSGEEFVDLYDGVGDLERKVIRAVGNAEERFAEDALRMMRAIRLAAELELAIDGDTLAAIEKMAQNMAKISKERIRDELSRIVMSSRPMDAILIMERVGLLPFVIPDLIRSIGVDQNRSHVYTVFEHLLRSLQHAADKGYSFETRLAALFHDIGKPETKRFEPAIKDCTFYGHEVVGAKVTKKALQELHFPNETVERVTALVRWHMFFSDPDQITLSAVRRMIRNVGKDHIQALLEVRICDRIGSGRPKEQPFRFRKYKAMVDEALRDPISVAMLKINGSRIMELTEKKPGPELGWTLHALLEEVLDDPKRNTEEYLEKRASELMNLTPEELKTLGEQGRDRQREEEATAVEEIHSKHGV